MKNTVIYLIRHSVRFDSVGLIQDCRTSQDKILKSEKVILSVEGERRAERLSNETEMQNIDAVYTSNCVRTIQTAKYLVEKQGISITIDERLDERRTGKPNEDKYPNWYELQFFDEDFKTEGGESQKDVRARFNVCFEEILKKHKGKRIAIFSHGRAISFFLMRWCKIEKVYNVKRIAMSFNGEIFFDKIFNAPEVIRLTLDENNNATDIRLIQFDDLEFMDT